MKYSKLDAKDYARENMKGIWAAAMNPFNEDFSFNQEGLRRNIRHWIDDLAIQGLFIAGKQGEFATMSLDERKRNMEIAVEECGDKAGTIMSCSDQNFDTVVELARPTRPPFLQLTEEEKERTREAFEGCGLRV